MEVTGFEQSVEPYFRRPAHLLRKTLYSWHTNMDVTVVGFPRFRLINGTDSRLVPALKREDVLAAIAYGGDEPRTLRRPTWQ